MIILPYSDGDFDGVVALWRETGIFKPYDDPKSEIARIQKNSNCLLYIGREGQGPDGRVVASILVGHDGYRGWIYKLAVAESHRGKGIGRRLMDEAVTWGRGHGAVEVVLTTWVGNEEAEAFYRRLGYRELSRVLYAPIGPAS